MSNDLTPSLSFWSRLGRAFVNLLRLVVILAILGGIAAGLYYGMPYLYEKFILPVEANSAQIKEIEDKQAADMALLGEQVTALQSRLDKVENRQTVNAQTIAELQGQVEAIETAIASHTKTLKQLEDMQAALDALAMASVEQQALLIGKETALAELQRQVVFSRAIELLSRARLYLSQSNFGLARQDIQASRDLLAGLQSEDPERQSVVLQEALWRLDLALANLPGFPVIAVDDVDIAWQLLVNNLNVEAEKSVTSAPPVDATPTPAPTITP